VRIAQILLATNNPHKVREIARVLSGLAVRVAGAREAGVVLDVAEDGATFEANAVTKAVAFATTTGEYCLADDSGLEVDALDGAPGVYSARYAGPQCDYAANNRKLLEELNGLPEDRRAARFVCVMAFAGPEGVIFTVRGEARGRIATAPRGDNGFGYDPVFYFPPADKTFAEMAPDEKNAVSHRGSALAAFRGKLERLLNQGVE